MLWYQACVILRIMWGKTEISQFLTQTICSDLKEWGAHIFKVTPHLVLKVRHV